MEEVADEVQETGGRTDRMEITIAVTNVLLVILTVLILALGR
jgi:hypothetical protein